MKKLMLIPIISLAAVSLAACSGGSSSAAAKTQQEATPATETQQPSATTPEEDDPLDFPINIPVPENSMFTIEDTGILRAQLVPGGIINVQIVIGINSSDYDQPAMQEVIRDFYYNYYYPSFEALDPDDYKVEGFIIFDDKGGEDPSDQMGVFMNQGTLVDAYEYITYDIDDGLFYRTSKYSPEVQFYTLDQKSKSITYDGDISILSEEEKAELIVEA